MPTLHLILGNCLFDDITPLNIQDGDVIVMIEDKELCTHFKYHKHKIILFLSAMRNYKDELETKLKNKKCFIEYIFIEKNKLSFTENLQAILQKYSLAKIQCYEIEDYFFAQKIKNFCQKNSIELNIIDSQNFITTKKQFALYRKSYKRLFMNDFYIWQRKRLGILLDSNQQPMGGKWSFDDENRKKLPKKIILPDAPILPTKKSKNKYLGKVIKIVDELFSDHFGESHNFWIATTREEALETFELFLKERFENFGPYEDAISKKETFLFHSALSPLLNCGLLTPKEVVEKTLQYFQKNNTHFSSVEGFIRQIIGWREFVRGCYHDLEYEEKHEKLNYFNHKNSLSKYFYEGTTGIEPLDDSIQKVLKYGYCHHIERLMIIGNIMLLCEIEPVQVYRWFMELFVDSSDWVMAANVYSMSQFSDGGINQFGFATKPYIGGSNYICKMSDYPKNQDWCQIVDGLYWRFIDKKRKLFLSNPRMSMMVKLLDKMDEDKKSTIFLKAENFLKEKVRV